MPSSDLALGCSALLRVAGLPIRLWVAAGNSELFGLLRRLGELDGQYRAMGMRIADRIGAELVPHPRMSSQERAQALRLRRRLHNADPVSEAECQDVADLAARVLATSCSELATELGQAVRCSARLADLERLAAGAVAAEQARLLRAPWELIQSSPVAQRALRGGNPETYRDIEQRLGDGESWGGKRLRQRSDYLWRMIARGATKTTPRAWLGHLALVPVTQDPLAPFPPVAVRAEIAANWVENIHGQRLELSGRALEQADPEVGLTIAPLHWHDGGHLQFWVIDPAEPTSMRDLRLRRTGLLDVIRAALQFGPMPLGQLETTLLPAPDERQRGVLRAFLGHLTGLGVLQVSMPPQSRFDLWRPLPSVGSTNGSAQPSSAQPSSAQPSSAQPSTVEVRDGDAQYVDVYRQAITPLPHVACQRLQEHVCQAVRVLALIDVDTPEGERRALPEEITEAPRPVLDLVAQRLRADEKSHDEKSHDTATERHHHHGWPPARTDGSGYARLLEWIAERIDAGEHVDISHALLDQLGAPEPALDWPLDCVLRVLRAGAGPVAVLDQLGGAGVLDARFASGLSELHGEVAQVTAYHEFLHRLEERAGIPFVELLSPPLSDRAANAVRRPLYTRAWTGDADLSTYCQLPEGARPRYVPLDAITLRRCGARVVAEVDGQQIWPVYHATRSPMPPWNLLHRLLLGASPSVLRWARPLGCSLQALGERSGMPRITIGGALVLSCAQWRITRDQLWDLDAPILTKARALEQLRRSLELPRWVFVANHPGGKPLPCDLESLRAIRILEGAAAQAAQDGMALEEMLPAPDQLAVADQAHLPGDQLASELVLRLPCDESPTAMAARLARALGELPLSGIDTMEGGDTNAEHHDTGRDRRAVHAGAL